MSRGPSECSASAVDSVRVQDNGKRSCERRYFISSLKGTDADNMARAIRAHWGSENRLHWHLDVTFGEDQSRMRKDFAAENVSRLRRMALNLLKRGPGKESLKNKRFRCSLDPDYLLKVLAASA